MAQRHDVKLGERPTDADRRDAIHIAVVPVVAAERLWPGDDVGFTEAGNFEKVGRVAKSIGIVDPFLKRAAQPGDRVWLLLYPQTITSLRHEWQHPDFPDAMMVEAPNKAASEKWLREFIDSADCPDYETVIAAAAGRDVPKTDDDDRVSYDNDGEYLTFYGRDAHSQIPPEFWDHVEVVTGKKIHRDQRARSFSCSC